MIGGIMKNLFWIIALAGLAAGAWFMSQGEDDSDASPELVIASALTPVIQIAGEAAQPSTLEERMAFHRVPGVSIAFLRDHEVEWTLTAGVRDIASGAPVDEDTVFQAASISKPVFATTLMLYRQDHALDLDADINTLMSRWQLPAHEWQDTDPVTLRRLLSHNAGTTVHGFRGYAAGEDVPSIIELLEGSPLSASDPVVVDIRPGSQDRYSGGGTTIAQLAFEDQSGQGLSEAAQTYVFEPLEMTRSAYSQPLAEALSANAATPYNSEGEPIEGGAHDYAPIMAAAGLWTTPGDLMRLAGAMQRAHHGQDEGWMSQETANAMLSRQFADAGLGFFVGEDDPITAFSHGGSNAGFRAQFFAHTDSGDGIAIMTNGANGSALIREIMIQVAAYYGWEDGPQPVIKNVHPMSQVELDAFVGDYRLAGSEPLIISIERADNTLVFHARPYLTDIVLRAEGENDFFAMNGMGVRFGRGDDGEVSTVHFFGEVGNRIEGDATD
jgi:CubicO group peptidase (beta-lactamase class C family)